MWKKQAALALLICLTVVLLCGCAQEQTTYPEAGTAPTRQPVRQADVLSQPTEAPQVVVSFPEDYDSEEDAEDDEGEDLDESAAVPGFSSRAAVPNSRYAGATPIPLEQYTTGQRIEYIVEMNDSYQGIASKFNTTLDSLSTLNDIEDITGKRRRISEYKQAFNRNMSHIAPNTNPQVLFFIKCSEVSIETGTFSGIKN